MAVLRIDIYEIENTHKMQFDKIRILSSWLEPLVKAATHLKSNNSTRAQRLHES